MTKKIEKIDDMDLFRFSDIKINEIIREDAEIELEWRKNRTKECRQGLSFNK